MEKNSQSRKWLLTINNPVEKGYTHENIKRIIDSYASVVYWCMSDETGEVHHTNAFALSALTLRGDVAAFLRHPA